jgi:putative tryptophan/tyrosine transport system substrate-binding protein
VIFCDLVDSTGMRLGSITDDMVASGFVGSLARPNGNMTGVSILATELDGKRQEILIEAVPGLRRMAALADSKNSAIAKLDEPIEAARARNIELSIHRVASGDEIAAAIDMAHASGATAQRVVITNAPRQSSAYYGPRRGAAPSDHLSVA